MCCFIPDHGGINSALQLLISWRWAPLKNGCIVPGLEKQDDMESRRQLGLHPKCRTLPLGEHRATGRAGSVLPSFCSSSSLTFFSSVWCPSAKQNKLKIALANAGQLGLQSAAHIQLLMKPGWVGGGNSYILLLSRQQGTWNDPRGLVYKVSSLLSSRRPRAHPKQGLGWVWVSQGLMTCLGLFKEKCLCCCGIFFHVVLSGKDTWHCRKAKVGIEVGHCVHGWRL